MTLKRTIRAGSFSAILALSLSAIAMALPNNILDGLRWRLVGPFRAGWATTVTGVPSQPDTFYFGAADGGVWKTTDAGRTWSPIFDHQAVGSVGALAVSASNPQIIYVGTGQVAPRYDIAAGDGVYKSEDGGHTWIHLGLGESRHIGRILVDPKNPDIVLVAALGHLFGPNPERGVYRSFDGGRTWEKALGKNSDTGAVDLAWDPSSPRVVYAALWQVRRYPWQAYFTPATGPGSGIYKSTDEGATWQKVGSKGLPSVDMGRIGLAVAPGSGGRLVYAMIEAGRSSGLFSSDDGGATWAKVNNGAGMSDWYFARLRVDPRDSRRIYAMGQSVRESQDGGKTFSIIKGSPGGDDYHAMWINPLHPERRILGSDQGATISINDDATWSSWYNQPTGQFYHLATDDRFPYWIYAGQQDSGTVGIASRSDYGQITYREWHPVGGDERDYDIPDPTDPQIVYGSGLGGRLSRWDGRTGQVANVSPWPVSTYGARPTLVKNRYTWFTPIAVAPQAPHALYLGAQHLFRSLDGGQTWNKISPDLTGAVSGAKNCSGNVATTAARACGYGVIYTIGLTPANGNVVWIGTDDGLIQVTRDAGKSWENVTPPGLADWSKVAQIDVSRHDPATAYAAIDRHRMDDFHPYIYRTHDFGHTWTEIDGDLPTNDYVNVVRQDPENPRLLFAGTRAGVFISFDDGSHWQSLELNLPTTGITDLAIHDDDLIAATLGRAIWILDDITPLRQVSADILTAPAHLFTPAVAYRLRRDENRDTPLPPETPKSPNAPAGAIIDYYFAQAPTTPVLLEVSDSAGNVVRHWSSANVPVRPPAERYFPASWLKPIPSLPAAAGLNRFVWDLRLPRPPSLGYGYTIAAVWGEDTPVNPQGGLVLPGRYTLRLRVNGQVLTQPLTVKMDPRVKVSPEDLRAQLALEREISETLGQLVELHQQASAVRDRLEASKSELARKRHTRGLERRVDAILKEIEPLLTGRGDENLGMINRVLASVETDLEGVDRGPTAAQMEVVKTYSERLKEARDHWDRVRSGELAKVDRALRGLGIAPAKP